MGIQNAYGSYEELAQDPDIDIVYIGTIQSTHLPLSKLMLNAGKHVLCEKPMCLNTDQVKEIFQLSKEKHKFFVEGVWSRSFEIYQRIKEEIQSGAIGDIQLVTASICLPLEATLKSFDKGDGCLHSIGLYTVQFANWICDNEMPKSIYAVGSLNDAGESN
ncbi:hypothetical protein FSP39_000632 [Pinctada imbricata]|uniref:Trans-1,2-dihydrobenzene-1,2-diol dehydrogenase n=1 Tax=Pinctada imbricata TaxID=66713 RepID=A0AA88YRS7_PINIB|nr:hypothetical protein FSP39_000632 [Pinctada imbricata]